MCVFVYTLPQLCGHTHFQNVSECAVARGPPSPLAGAAEEEDGQQRPRPRPRPHPTLASPVFLFDTARDAQRTPDSHARRFACQKRRAVRPAPTLCDGCARGTRRRDEESGEGRAGGRDDGGAERLAVPAVAGSGSSGSEVGLVAASGSASEVSTSGASTPRSFWKHAHPTEVV